MGAARSGNAAQEMRWGTWALAVAMGIEKQEPKDANGFFKENEDLVAVLRTTQRKQSKMTAMFRLDTYYPFGCLASTPLSAWRESPAPSFLMRGRASCLLEKLKEPGLLSASPGSHCSGV